MNLYLILLVILFLGSYLDSGRIRIGSMVAVRGKKFVNVYVGVVFLVLLFLSAFRYMIGTDYSTYTFAVLRIKDNFSFDWLNFEPGFILLNYLIGPFTQSGQLLIIVASVITLVLFFVSFKQSVSPTQSIFLFYSLFLYCMSFNLIRQFIAIGIAMVSLKYIINQSVKKFIVCVVIAMLFHTSAILIVPLFFLQRIQMRLRTIVVLMVGLGLFSILYNPIMSVFFRFFPQYATYKDGSGGSSTLNILILILSLSMLLLVREGHYYTWDDKKTLNCYIAAILLGLFVTAFSVKILFFARASYYFFCVTVFSIPFCWSRLRNSRYYYILKGVTMVFAIVLFVRMLTQNTGEVVPYQLWDFSQL